MRWWQIRKRNEDLERELRSDLELEEEEQRESGLTPEEARLAAHRAFGNSTLIREHIHETWGWAPVERLWQDMRYGLRQLSRNPGFTVVTVFTLALGIAINTTIFSAVSAFLLRKPPVKDPDTLCTVSSRNSSEALTWSVFRPPIFSHGKSRTTYLSAWPPSKGDVRSRLQARPSRNRCAVTLSHQTTLLLLASRLQSAARFFQTRIRPETSTW